MNTTSLPANLFFLLLCTVMTGGPRAWAGESDTAQDLPPASASGQEQAYRQAISGIESSRGAYAAGLSEQLLSLGLSLQTRGRHDEAIGLFKRGAHLARINDGLYSTEQIPLLQGQISSHIAQGHYGKADERQRYLYRVQSRSLDSGEPRTMALMQQANWQYNAYRLGLGPQSYTRIMNMWDFYRLALNDILAREGESSPNLLLPLHGMLQAQYLISSYRWEDEGHSSSDEPGARQELNRFFAYRSQSYQKGNAVIGAIHNIEAERGAEQAVAAARARVMQGDWHLWNGERQQAWQAYQEAVTELDGRDDAKLEIEQLLLEPVALPDISGLRPLPPATGAEGTDILLEFGVTDRGRVVNVERLDDNEDNDVQAHRLMRKLRKTQFRPRLEAGQPVETEKLVKSFNIE